MGLPYGSIPRKTVPREEQPTAMDYSVLFDFEVSFIFHSIESKTASAILRIAEAGYSYSFFFYLILFNFVNFCLIFFPDLSATVTLNGPVLFFLLFCKFFPLQFVFFS